jgi:hypothetical protein
MEISTSHPPSVFVKTESKIAAPAEADFMGIYMAGVCGGAVPRREQLWKSVAAVAPHICCEIP